MLSPPSLEGRRVSRATLLEKYFKNNPCSVRTWEQKYHEHHSLVRGTLFAPWDKVSAQGLLRQMANALPRGSMQLAAGICG